jgi:S1-C subfamily serine protease
MKTCMLGLLTALVACTASKGQPDSGPNAVSPADAATRSGTPVAVGEKCEDYEQNNIQVFRSMAPATVFVTQKRRVQDYWSMRTSEVESGTGSGFVWDDKGHIVTNYHVVANANTLEVTLYDGTSLPAKFVGGDPNKDVAVLRIDPTKAKSKLTAISHLAKDEKLEVGQTTIAIGNPFGLDHTLTVGVVSALGREVKGYGGTTIRGMIQTDASINPGNSGGPLLDRHGHLMGMNTMIFSKVGQSSGIGFAVPSPILRRVVPQIIEHGKPQRVGLGVDLVSDAMARRAGIRGVVINQVFRGSPAAAAGLRGIQRTPRGTFAGDIIVGVDGEKVETFDDLYNALDGRNPGDVAKIHLLRGDSEIEVEITLALVN